MSPFEILCILVAYLVSVVRRTPPAELDGLTVWTMFRPGATERS